MEMAVAPPFESYKNYPFAASVIPSNFLRFHGNYNNYCYKKKPCWVVGGGGDPLFPAFTKSSGGRGRRLSAKAALGGLLGGIFKGTDTGESTRQQYGRTVEQINRLELELSALSDSELRERTSVLKERARRGDSLDSLLPEAFAVVREASKRVLGLRPFDVQLIGKENLCTEYEKSERRKKLTPKFMIVV